MKHVFVPPCVFISGLADTQNDNINLYDMTLFRLVTKEFNKEFNFYKKEITSNRISRYKELLNIAKSNGIDVVDILLNSNFNLPEFDRICNNMVLMENRDYGVKYGCLFRHKFFDKAREYNNHNVLNNITIFRLLFDYSKYLIKKQKKAPTNIEQYPFLWLSDYMNIYINHKLNQNIGKTIIDFVGFDYFKDILTITDYNFSILNFYEILVRCYLKIIDTEIVLVSSTFKEFSLILTILSAIYDIYKPIDKEIVDSIFYYILIYLKYSLTSVGKHNFSDIFLASVLDKIHETLAIVMVHRENNTITNTQLLVEGECNEILHLLNM